MNTLYSYLPSWLGGPKPEEAIATQGTVVSAPPVADTPAGEGGVGGRRRRKSKKTRRATKRSRSGRKSSRL